MRHPSDPDTVPDTKAMAALCLGVLGVATGWALGGAVPATVALVLARQATEELVAGQGWRTGDRHVLWARRLAWAALGLAAAAVVLLVVALLLGPDVPRDFPSTVD